MSHFSLSLGLRTDCRVELELYSCGDETVPMCSRGTVQFCLQSISVTWFFARNLAGLVGGATKAPYSQRFCDLAGSLSYSLSVQFASDWSILITNSPRSPSKSCLTDRHTGRHVRHCMYPVGQARIRVCVGRWDDDPSHQVPPKREASPRVSHALLPPRRPAVPS